MSPWYFVIDGKSCGPLSLEEIIAAMEKGTLGPLDLLYKEGSECWTLARNIDEFREVFKATWEDEDLQPIWVLLRKKSQDQGVAYQQSGPYSSKELQNKIKLGEVDHSDFIWKEGMTSWEKLAESKYWSQLFGPIDRENWQGVTMVPEDVAGDELLKNVMRATAPKKTPFDNGMGPDLPPIEAVGPDLTQVAPPLLLGECL